MHVTKKIMLFLSVLFSTALLYSYDFITINDPAYDYIINDTNVTFDGTSSQPNFQVQLIVNSTHIGSTTTDVYGNWSFTLQDLSDGTYTLTANLLSDAFEIIATEASIFTMINPDNIIISTPSDGDAVFINPLTVTGSASVPSTTVELYLDDVLVETTATDVNGNWQTSCTITSNGAHTLLAQLTDIYGYPITSTSTDIIAAIPIIFPTGKSQVRVTAGSIPTTGSGSGPGYTYTISGSIATINFIPAFSSIPSIIATGLRSSGSSTVTVTSISTTATSIAFSSGTQNIGFTAAIFS